MSCVMMSYNVDMFWPIIKRKYSFQIHRIFFRTQNIPNLPHSRFSIVFELNMKIVYLISIWKFVSHVLFYCQIWHMNGEKWTEAPSLAANFDIENRKYGRANNGIRKMNIQLRRILCDKRFLGITKTLWIFTVRAIFYV